MREQATRAEMGRPVFMSKAQREAAAAEVEAEAAELDELMQEAERAQRQEYMAKVRDELREQRETVRRNAYGGGGGPSSAAAGASSSSAKAEPPKSKEEEDREKEMTQIKNAYLGVKKGKKKVAKISEKFRFSFDWANDEDTSVDLNPLYEKKHEASPTRPAGSASLARAVSTRLSASDSPVERVRAHTLASKPAPLHTSFMSILRPECTE